MKETSDWMLGTFSDTPVMQYSTIGPASLARYEFRASGTLAIIAVTNCAENREELLEEYEWSRLGDSLVIVDAPEPENEVFQEWVVRLGETCNILQVHEIQDGEVRPKRTLWRGAVCLRELPPCEEVECPSCETTWCDEPPPACGE